MTYIETLKCYEIDRSSLQLIELIGTGRFSEVWRAKLGRTVVAVKVIEKGKHLNEFIEDANLHSLLPRRPKCGGFYAGSRDYDKTVAPELDATESRFFDAGIGS